MNPIHEAQQAMAPVANQMGDCDVCGVYLFDADTDRAAYLEEVGLGPRSKLRRLS